MVLRRRGRSVQAQVALILFFVAQIDVLSLRPIYEQAVERAVRANGADDPSVARALTDLGLFLRNQGLKQEAEPILRRALAIDEKASDEASTAADLENLISVVPSPGDLIQRLSLSADPAIAARNLARLASASRNKSDALRLYREALTKAEKASGPSHPRVAVRLNDVALLLDPPAAEPLLRRALAIQEKSVDPNPDKASTLNNLANVLLATNRVAQAEPLLRRAMTMLEDSLGPRNPRVATAASNLADVFRARNDNVSAQKLYERALAIDEAVYGPNHPEVAVDLENLAELFESTGKPQQAQPLRARVARIKAAHR